MMISGFLGIFSGKKDGSAFYIKRDIKGMISVG
jgi:hypothetical protein